MRLVVPATLLADLCSVYSCTGEREWLFQRDFRREMSGQCRRKISLLLDSRNFFLFSDPPKDVRNVSQRKAVDDVGQTILSVRPMRRTRNLA